MRLKHSILRRLTLVAAAGLAVTGLGVALPCAAQDPAIIEVHTLSGATAGEMIQACIDMFGSQTAPANAGGTCDARGLRGGQIATQVHVDVDNLRIVLGAGVYNITADEINFLIEANNVTIEGQGPSTHLNAAGRPSCPGMKAFCSPVLQAFDDSRPDRLLNLHLHSFRITGNKNLPGLVEGMSLIRVKEVDGVRIENLTLDRGGSTGIGVREARDVVIAENRISMFSNAAIRVQGDSEFVQVRGNFIDDVGAVADEDQPGTAGIAVVGALGVGPKLVRVTNNTVVNSSAGTRVSRGENGLPSDVSIAANTFAFSRPKATKEGEGIGSMGRNVQILANRITECRVNCILLWRGQVENVSLLGNMVSNASWDPAQNHNAISLATRGEEQKQLLVTGNVTFDDRAEPSQNYMIAADIQGGVLLGTITKLLVGTNIGSGRASDGPLQPLLVPEATISGNLSSP